MNLFFSFFWWGWGLVGAFRRLVHGIKELQEPAIQEIVATN